MDDIRATPGRIAEATIKGIDDAVGEIRLGLWLSPWWCFKNDCRGFMIGCLFCDPTINQQKRDHGLRRKNQNQLQKIIIKCMCINYFSIEFDFNHFILYRITFNHFILYRNRFVLN